MPMRTARTTTAGVRVLIIFLVGFVAITLAGSYLINRTAERTVAEDAERTSLSWAIYIGSELKRIEEIAGGAPLLPSEHEFLDGVRQFGDVFRFKLFDERGRLRLVSDDLNADAGNDQTLVEHNAKAASVIKTGIPHTGIEDYLL